MNLPIITKEYEKIIEKIHAQSSGINQANIFQTLNSIKLDIIEHQDSALIKYCQKFDQINPDNFNLKVTPSEIEDAYKQVDADFIRAFKQAKINLEKYFRYQLPKDWYIKANEGSFFGAKFTPIQKAGLYVPGGRAPYPSTVLMNSIPAKIAKVSNLFIATPPRSDGSIDPYILVASDICQVDQIYKIGGAQAIFALAYGTSTITKVDKIVGPGNIYVSLAKQMVYGEVDIDKIAGPSEVLVYINDSKYLSFAVADFLAQLEHDPLASAILITENVDISNNFEYELSQQFSFCKRKDIIAKALKNSYIFLTQSQKQSLSLINKIASEHLVLLIDNAEDLISQIYNAGAIFIGPYTPVTLGDYYAGPNHVLPTNGTARFASPLGVLDFLKSSSLLKYSQQQLSGVASHLQALTKVEGFDAHQNAVNIRLKSD